VGDGRGLHFRQGRVHFSSLVWGLCGVESDDGEVGCGVGDGLV
jgi:hypothetical protein